MNPQAIDRAVEALRNLLSRTPEVRSAILYGSCARGTAREDSDIDVLVLVSTRRVGPLREAMHGIESAFDVNISPLVVRAEEIWAVRASSTPPDSRPRTGRPRSRGISRSTATRCSSS